MAERNIMEEIMAGGSYGNVTRFDKEHAAELFNNHGDIVGSTLGPDNSPSLIQFTDEDMLNEGTAQDGCYSTKDGYTVLNRIRHLNKYDQAVINTSFATTKLNNDTSGDGTTTSYVFFAKLFWNIYNNSYKHVMSKNGENYRRMTDGQFSKLLRKSIKAISHRVDTVHRTLITDYDELIDIARVSLNNDDENLKPLRALLLAMKDIGVPAASVNIAITSSSNNSSTFSVNSGYEFSSKLFLRTSDTVSIPNARFIMLDRGLITHDQTNAVVHLIEATRNHFMNTGEKFVVAFNTIDESYVTYIESYYRNQEQLWGGDNYERHLYLLEYNDTKGITPTLYQQDMLIYFNSSIFNITEAEVKKAVKNVAIRKYNEAVEELKNRNYDEYNEFMNNETEQYELNKAIFEEYDSMSTPDQIEKIIFNSGFAKLPMVSIDDATNTFMTIVKKNSVSGGARNEQALLERINSIRDIQNKSVSMNEKEMCARRFMNLVQQYAVITIGAPTETERDTLYSANLDATLAVNSAAKIGIVSGMCIPTMLSAWEFANHDYSVREDLKEILDLYEFDEYERIIFKDVAKDIHKAASFISESILKNAELSEGDIANFNDTLIDKLTKALESGERFKPEGYDVLSFEWSNKIVSPYESEKSYINAGLLTVIPFITAKLFIHPNQYFTTNVKSSIPAPPPPTAESSMTVTLGDEERVVKDTWLRRLIKRFF